MRDLFLNGFGYDTSTDDYLLVRLEVILWEDYMYSGQDPDVIASHPTRIHLFSMKTNSWFYLEGTYAQYVDLCNFEFKAGSFLNYALHWLVISVEINLQVIIAFDLVERSLSEIPLPQNFASEHQECLLRVMGECLSLCCTGASITEIWVMKKYKVQSSWTKLFVFSTSNIPYNSFFPICFTKHGGVFGRNSCGRLMILDKGLLLDQCTPWLDNEGENCFPFEQCLILHCGIYRESLLSLPNVFEEASKDDQLASFIEKASEDEQ